MVIDSQNKRIILLVLLLYLGLFGLAQEQPVDYNPFVSVNLDDTTKLSETTVVGTSYHRYWLTGDENYTENSTFVWYVQNGRFGNYNPATDTWIESTSAIDWNNGAGYQLDLLGKKVNGNANSAEIWVKWDDNANGKFGYIAVYERSSKGCIEQDIIHGFKHRILDQPEVWFVLNKWEACSYNPYDVTFAFRKLDSNSYPYQIIYNRPDGGGNQVSDTLILNYGDLDINQKISVEFEPVFEDSETQDEKYIIRLERIRDKYGSDGLLAPLGKPTQFEEIDLTINHLPQTGPMNMGH